MGYMVTKSELFGVLANFGCDRNEQGQFCVDGPIHSFLDMGEEFVVGDEAVYYVRGVPRNLASAISKTSYRTIPVEVISCN